MGKIPQMQSQSQEYIALARLIKGETIKRGWTKQNKLAKESGVSASTINRFIKHGTLIETENLLAVLKALDLLDGIIVKNNQEGTHSPRSSLFSAQALSRYGPLIEKLATLLNEAGKDGNTLIGALDYVLNCLAGERKRLEDLKKMPDREKGRMAE